MSEQTVAGNRLQSALSPYLLQHRNNPLHRREWSPETLKDAEALDRPILPSIGYAACHWCHVMAHESFEDEATAAIMNRLFVSVKVDREERPDIDGIYMTALLIRPARYMAARASRRFSKPSRPPGRTAGRRSRKAPAKRGENARTSCRAPRKRRKRSRSAIPCPRRPKKFQSFELRNAIFRPLEPLVRPARM